MIQEQHETQGVDAEYAWIRKNYPGYNTQSQTLLAHGKKSYDRLHIVSASGDAKDIYFDITQFYGKF